ncbi:MAG: DUF4271 domain-containing protein [Bacteroidota bacterium]
MSGRQNERSVVHDLEKEWLVFDKQSNSYVPYIGGRLKNGGSIGFLLSQSAVGKYLLISADEQVSIFVDNSLIATQKQSQYQYFNLDSLRRALDLKGRLFFVLYADKLASANLKTLLVDKSLTNLSDISGKVPAQTERIEASLTNFLILGAVVLLSFFAVLLNFFPKILSEYYQLDRAIALRDREENIFRGRVFNKINILIFGFHSLAIAYFVIAISNLSDLDITQLTYYNLSTTFLVWIELSLAILVAIMLKFFLLKNFTDLYNMIDFRPVHFFNFLRISMAIFILLIILLLLAYFVIEAFGKTIYNGLIIMTFSLMLFRVLILFFKLMNFSSYRKFHLFSYLCATEIAPLAVTIGLVLRKF